MSEAGTLERLLLLAGQTFTRIGDWMAPDRFDDLLYELGTPLPSGFLGPTLTAALGRVSDEAQAIEPLLGPLRDAIEAPGGADITASISAGSALGAQLARTASALADLAAEVKQGALGIVDPVQRDRLAALAEELALRILSRLILERLDTWSPAAGPILALTGLADDQMDYGERGNEDRPAHYQRRIYFERIAGLIDDPAAHLASVFGWGTPGFDAYPWLERLALLWRARGLRTLWNDAHGPAFEPGGLQVGPVALVTDRTLSPPGLAAVLGISLAEDIDQAFELGDGGWVGYVTSSARIEAGLKASLSPAGEVSVSASGAPVIAAAAGIRFTAPGGGATRLFGLAGGSYVETKSVDLSVQWQGLSSEPSLRLATDGLNCVLDLGGGDNFLSNLTGGGQGGSSISLGATWSPSKGAQFTGSATLEIAVPAHARIGPATIETVYLVAGFDGSAITLELSAALRGSFGPFTAVVDHVGATFKTTFPDGGGNLGPAQLEMGFKPPSGVGLSIDGGGFSGGGFMRFEPEKGQYAGSLELQFQGVIDVKAIGVLDTRLPDGSDGFSLILIITAEFTPIQLGFGFILNGVGGLLGVNRTVLQDQLRTGIRSGVLDSILFPKDVVANAPRIISDLQRVFPPKTGRVLIGPMAKLGWGSPTLVSLELGIILEIPRPAFLVVGVLRMALPADDVAILKIQVNFLGSVDFDKKQVSFDAVLFDSRLLTYTLTGSMAVRVYWGEDANFLLSAGGFNPSFDPPPLDLPPLERLAISLYAANPRLRAEAYFAITSNTVQFGAKVEVEAGVSVFNVYGFIAFDALITFDPFHFVAHAAGMVAVRSGSSTLFSISLDLTLDGPSPWHAYVRGSFEIGFIFTVTISVSYDVTFGQNANTALPAIDVRPLIEAALVDDRNWRAVPEGGARSHVTLRALPAEAPLVLAPLGSLAVIQRVVPLGLKLARFGSRAAAGQPTYTIVDVQLGGAPFPNPQPLTEQFAPAQFLDMSDADKLSQRSFQPFAAGIELAGTAMPKADFQRCVDVVYEVIYFRKARRRLFFGLRDALVGLLVAISAAGRSKLSASRTAPTGLGTPRVALQQGSFAIAGISDLKRLDGTAIFASEAAAIEAVRLAAANDSSLAGKYQVVGSHEVAA
jgi:hypothetical protein